VPAFCARGRFLPRWLTADEVIHTWPPDRLREFLRKKTDMAAAKLARERA
jgi:protoporphyrinogen oxidase